MKRGGDRPRARPPTRTAQPARTLPSPARPRRLAWRMRYGSRQTAASGGSGVWSASAAARSGKTPRSATTPTPTAALSCTNSPRGTSGSNTATNRRTPDRLEGAFARCHLPCATTANSPAPDSGRREIRRGNLGMEPPNGRRCGLRVPAHHPSSASSSSTPSGPRTAPRSRIARSGLTIAQPSRLRSSPASRSRLRTLRISCGVALPRWATA
jgi:hypothetical protein